MRSLKILLSLLPAAGLAQAPQTPTPTPASSFEVATIKPAAPDARGRFISPGPGGGIRVTNMTLKDMVEFAWSVQPFQISGGPAWLDSVHYDIVAKPEARASQSELQMMLQALLTDRFQLRVHRETKELPIYALVLARKDGRLGPDLVESKEGSCQTFDPSHPPPPPEPGVAPPRFCGNMMMSPIGLDVLGHTISDLTPLLSRMVERKVVDETGLTGKFDISLQFSPPGTLIRSLQSPDDNPTRTDAAGPSIFTAFQDRLGLKFESKKGQVEVIVIDQAEKPSDN